MDIINYHTGSYIYDCSIIFLRNETDSSYAIALLYVFITRKLQLPKGTNTFRISVVLVN